MGTGTVVTCTRGSSHDFYYAFLWVFRRVSLFVKGNIGKGVEKARGIGIFKKAFSLYERGRFTFGLNRNRFRF